MLKPFFIALQFLTRLPVPSVLSGKEQFTPQQLGKSVIMYPVVGGVIGFILLAVIYLIHQFTPAAQPLITAAIVLFVWVLITGALHLDGLSDSADAWVGGYGDRERSMAIMKDPCCGPAGVSIVVIVLMVKFAALASVIATSFESLIIIPVLARAAIIILFLTTPYVRKDGIGASHAAHIPKAGALLMLLAVTMSVVYLLQFRAPWLILMLAIVFVLLRQMMKIRLDGTTGDTTGALVEIMEMTGLTVLAVFYTV